MQVAAWLDVALEGGVLELERALADYRGLRRLLFGEWRVRARRVAQSAEHVRRNHLQVDSALERARRRARVDEAAKPGLVLAEQVEKERASLHAMLSTVRGQPAQFAVQVDWLCQVAGEEAHYERSVVRFRQERAGWTVLFSSLAMAAAAVPWFIASKGGELGTILSAEGLEEPPVWILLVGLLGSVMFSSVRLDGWHWLGVKPPLVLRPIVLSVAFAAGGTLTLVSLAMRTPVPIASSLAVFTGVGVLDMLVSWWRPDHDTSASDIGASR